MRTARSKKFEFSFSVAVGVAVVLHVALGLLLKYNLVLATPINTVAKLPPVTMRFVEVPPNSPTIRETPNTRNISDANRKAGPLPGKQEAPTGSPGPRSFTRQPQVQRQTQAPVEKQQTPEAAAPPVQQPAEQAETGIPVQSSGKPLSTALKNLDKYIAGGAGGEQGGEGNGGQPRPGSGSGVLFDTKGHDLGPWGNQVVAIVRSNWIIPVAAQLGLRGVVGITFQADRQGNITHLEVISESGVPSFDQAALNALKSSNPLPPLPVDYPEPVLTAVFRFFYNTPLPAD